MTPTEQKPVLAAEPEKPGCYTAARIAAVLGMSKRGIQSAIGEVPASQAVIVNGQGANAWAVSVLPSAIQERLQRAADSRKVQGPEQLLQAGGQAWEPLIPFNAVTQAARDKALKLQRALSQSLIERSDLNISKAEFERMAVRDYEKTFGHQISSRQIRRLIKRTQDRDGGAEEFRRTELYLDEIPQRERPKPAIADAYLPNAELAEVIATLKNPAAPTDDERAYFWVRVFEHFETETDAGKRAKKVKRGLLQFLFSSAPFLADSLAGLRKQFDRKFKAWCEDRRPAAVRDNRPDKSGRHGLALSQADKDRLVGEAVLFHGGRLSETWRELARTNGLSELTLGHYLGNSKSKSYVPRNIRRAVSAEIAAMADIHRGPRQAQLNGAHISRDWSSVPAGDWYQADDVTLPIYYYEPNEEGWFTLWRGQCLVFIDLRSTCILGYVLLTARNYNSLAIRTLITKVCDEYGLPRKGFYFERGIWESSKLLTGDASKLPLSYAEVECGLRDLGLQFIHARLPRAKPIEGVLGAVQNLMEGEPGYCGRDETKDKFERLQRDKLLVASRKLDPTERFRSADEWTSRLDELFEKYNTAPQEGKMTKGLSPDEARSKFQNSSDPQIKFDARCRYLLAHHKRPIRVTRNGIPFGVGGKTYVYRSEETGRLIGQTVLAWFNPETPDILCVTDMDCKNPFAVERAQDVPAIDAPPELLAQEMRRAAAHSAPIKARYRILKAKFATPFRPNLVDRDAAELGVGLRQQTETLRTRRQEQTSRIHAAQCAASKCGIVLSRDAQSSPETIADMERLAELLTDEDPSEANPAPGHG